MLRSSRVGGVAVWWASRLISERQGIVHRQKCARRLARHASHATFAAADARASGVIVWGCRPPGATGLQRHAYFAFSGCASMRPTTCEACVFSCSLCRGCSSRGESDLYPNAAGLALLRCRCEPNVVSSSLALVTRFSFALPGAGTYGIHFNWRMLIKG